MSTTTEIQQAILTLPEAERPHSEAYAFLVQMEEQINSWRESSE